MQYTKPRLNMTYSLSEASNVPQFLNIFPVVTLPTLYFLSVYSDHNLVKAAVFGPSFTLVRIHANKLETKKGKLP